MTNAKVVDTNVILVANRQHEEMSPRCVANCIRTLQEISSKGKIVIDDGFRILKEYQNKTSPRSSKRVGDAFVKWVLNNRNNPEKCEQVALIGHERRGFESFPDDPDLAIFDPADRVFVAVSAVHPEKPPILEAADSKWLDWSAALARNGMKVQFLCQQDLKCFHKRKFGK